jgi:centromeric protein E
LQHEERAFVLKFSAIKIYNEVVRDLLSAESTSLRLWDDVEVRAILTFI